MSLFEFSDEQRELRRVSRAYVTASFPESEVRRLMETAEGYDRGAWEKMARQLGLQGLIIPERYGGAGAGPVELAIVLEEMGRRLAPVPFLSTVLATVAILESGDEAAAADLLPPIADGECVATLAVAEDSGRWDAPAVRCRASPAGSGWVLRGTKSFVTDGHAADLLVIAARADNGIELFAVDGRAPGLRRTALTGFDPTRRLTELHLDGTPARLLGELGGGDAALARILDLVRVAVAAEQAGSAEFVLQMAVGYAKERVQFGRAIGSFQAVKHMCADALVDVESARSAAYYAAWAAADHSLELATVAPLARAFCSDTLLETAATNIQVHGGIAFTWEHPAHLYYRRAKSGAQLWGDSRAHRDVLATQIGL
jgi:alkylation response protein AidB-like acyl-CoA dehydrogenase